MTTTLLPRRLSYVHYLLALLALANVGLFCFTTLREAAVLGTAGCAAMLFLITLRETRSRWWGIMSLGLFTGSCLVMNSQYDEALRDTSLIFLVLAGCYLIGYSQSRLRDSIGMLLLTAAFCTKPLGLLFVLGGLAFLLKRDIRAAAPWYRSWPSLAVALVSSSIAYLTIPPQLLGSPMHDLAWSAPLPNEIGALAERIGRYFGLPAILAGAGLQLSLERDRPLSIWLFFLPVAFLSAVLATMTPASNSNAFTPFQIWLIISAVLSLPHLSRRIRWLDQAKIPVIALALSMLALSYNPAKLMIHQTEAPHEPTVYLRLSADRARP